MLERLGHVLGWLGNIFAVLTLIGAGTLYYLEQSTGKILILAIGAGAALVIYLFGRALRYIFAGPTKELLGKIGSDGYKEFRRID